MNIIICPGIHSSKLTEDFLAGLSFPESNLLVCPITEYPPYSPLHLYFWLNKQELISNNLFFITFSAGVVGGIGTAIALQLEGYHISGFVAIDGWGVPLFTNIPIYRVSHDYFTHWSSAILGTGNSSFYCDPPVSHLEIWRSPQEASGWEINQHQRIRCSVKDYLRRVIEEQWTMGN